MVDLLVPGRCPGSGEFSLAADLGLVAVLELGRAEFSLAVDLSWVAGPATRDAEFLLVENPGCLSLCRRGRSCLGSLLGHLVAAYFLKAKGRPGHQGIKLEAARGQGPSLNDFPKAVRSHHPLVRPHAPGGSWRRDERCHQTATATKSPLASSVTSVSGLDERCDPGVRNARMGLLS